MTLPPDAKTALIKLAGGLEARGLEVEKPVFSGRTERWCDLAYWKDPVEICVTVYPYLGRNHSFWVGFASKDKAQVTRLVDVYKSTRGLSIPELYTRDWRDNMKMKPKGVQALKLSGGVAAEDYLPNGGFGWFGIYLPVDDSTSNKAYSFLTDVIAMNRGTVRPAKDGPTEREAMRRERLTQGAFRTSQLKVWRRCAVTQCAIETLLQASHITPWAEDPKVRNSRDNGILLVPTLHKLFDDGFISFQDDGRIMIAESMMPLERENLGLHENMRVLDGFNEKQALHIAEHRKRHGFE
jgi:hypothetical protein